MPCYTEPPNDGERLRLRLNELLDEAGEATPRTKPFFMGASRDMSLDGMTAWLCEWCRRNDVSAKSLELQLWWRDHQRWDAERKSREEAAVRRREMRERALAKLTPEERELLK